MSESLIKDIPLEVPFKASLNCFDADQTYDLLACSKVDVSICNLIKNKLGNHSLPLDLDLSIYLIDRFTPDDSKWCNEWVTKTYEYLKVLSRTWLLGNGEINGSDYGFEPPYKATLPSALDLPDFPNEVQIVCQKGKSLTITWLEYDDESPQNEFIKNEKVYEYTKRNKTLFSTDKEENKITLKTKNWLHNSLVITSFNDKGKEVTEKYYKLRGLFDNQIPLLMYENLDETWNKIITQLRLTDCQVLTGVTATVKTDLEIFEGNRKYPMNVENFGAQDPYYGLEEIAFSAPVFQKVPDNYYYASLIYANNDYWQKNKNNATQVKEDLGKKLSIYYDKDNEDFNIIQSDTYGFFHKWRDELIENNPTGYDVSRSDFPNSLLSGIDFFPKSYLKNCRIMRFPSNGTLCFSDGSPVTGQKLSRLNQVIYFNDAAWKNVPSLSLEEKTDPNSYWEENILGTKQFWKRIALVPVYRQLLFTDELYYHPNKDFLGGDSFSFIDTNSERGGNYFNSCSIEAWKEIIVTEENKNNRIRILMNRNLSLSDSHKILTLDYPIIQDCELSLFSTFNNQFKGVDWYSFDNNPFLSPSSYPLLDGLPDLASNQIITSNGSKKGYKFRMYLYPKTSLDLWGVNSIISQDFVNTDQTGSMVLGEKYFQLRFTHSAASVSSMIRYFEETYENRDKKIGRDEIDSYETNPFLSVIPFLGSDDPNLFATWQVGLIKNGIDIKSHFETDRYYGEGGTRFASLIWNRKEITTKQAITINVDAQDIQDIKVNHYLSKNEIQETFDSTNEGDVSLEIYDNGNSVNWNYWNQLSVSQDILLNRDLRITEYIIPPDYVQLETIDEKQKRTNIEQESFKAFLDKLQKKENEDYYELVYLTGDKWEDKNPIQLKIKKCYVVTSPKTLILPSGLNNKNKVAIAILPCYDKDGKDLPSFMVSIVGKQPIESTILTRSYELIEYNNNDPD